MLAAQAIRAGDARLVVAGGMESMSNVPYYLRGMRDGVKFGNREIEDGLIHDGLWCSFGGCHMGGHAEYTAAKAGQLGLSRVLAAEARPYDIRVTSLLPGATDTPIWDDRPGFDRAKMMQPADVASFLVSIVARPGISVEEVTITPPAGVL